MFEISLCRNRGFVGETSCFQQYVQFSKRKVNIYGKSPYLNLIHAKRDPKGEDSKMKHIIMDNVGIKNLADDFLTLMLQKI